MMAVEGEVVDEAPQQINNRKALILPGAVLGKSCDLVRFHSMCGLTKSLYQLASLVHWRLYIERYRA